MRAIEPLLKMALLGMFALVAWKGIELSRFAWLQDHVDEVIQLSARDQNAQLATQASELGSDLSRWHNVIGVQSDAVLAFIAIKRISSPLTLHDLEPEAVSILSVRPMSAQAWGLLAGSRLLRGKPIEQVASALETSLMLAPNEDVLMAERLVYGLIIWEYLAPSAKQRIASDLSIISERGVSSEIEKARTIIALKSADIRSDIRARLETQPNHQALVDKFRL